MVQIIVAAIATLGTLCGVTLGALLTSRTQRTAWLRQEEQKSVQERREVCAEFIGTAREWRAVVMSPEAKMIAASTVSRSRHASGGNAKVKILRYRAELGLVVHNQSTMITADALISATRRLAEARGRYAAGKVPDPIVQRCRDTERLFLEAAGTELGSPAVDLRYVPPPAEPDSA